MFGLTLKRKLDKAILEIKELQRENKVLECSIELRGKINNEYGNMIDEKDKTIEKLETNNNYLKKGIREELLNELAICKEEVRELKFKRIDKPGTILKKDEAANKAYEFMWYNISEKILSHYITSMEEKLNKVGVVVGQTDN